MTECICCGSSPEDRETYKKRAQDDTIETHILRCPFCEGEKCCMCDMGNDVRCLNCGDFDDE